MTTKPWFFALVALVSLALAGCGSAASEPAAPAPAPEVAATPAPDPKPARDPEPAPDPEPKPAPQPVPDAELEQPELAGLGDPGIDVIYTPSGKPDLDLWISVLRSGKFVEHLTALIDHKIKLPRMLPVVVARCNRVNASYYPNRHMVVLCPELIVYFAKMFGTSKKLDFEKPAERDQVVEHTIKAAVFTLFHELGHALVGELELPVTGRNEDVADQAAAWILFTSGDGSLAESIFSAADWFAYEHDRMKSAGGEQTYWGVHSLNKQRYYNLLCWAYGAQPKGIGKLARNKLPAKRLARCGREWKQIDRAFKALLKPHTRPKAQQKKRLEMLRKLINDKVPPTADAKACRAAVEHVVTVQAKAHIAKLEAEGKMPKDEAGKEALKKKMLPGVNAGLKRGMMLCLTAPWSKERIECTKSVATREDLEACKAK